MSTISDNQQARDFAALYKKNKETGRAERIPFASWSRKNTPPKPRGLGERLLGISIWAVSAGISGGLLAWWVGGLGA